MTDPLQKAVTDHESIQRRIRRERTRQMRAVATALRSALRAAAARLSAGSAAFR